MRKLSTSAATLADIPSLTAIAVTAPDPWLSVDIEAALRDAARAVEKIQDGAGSTLGFGCIRFIDGDSAELEMLVIEPQARGKGAGRALLASLLDTAWQKGVRRCLLEVRTDNEAAVELYKRMGFNILAQRRRLYGNPVGDGYTMECVVGWEE